YLRGVKVGDTIRVVRHDKKLDYDTRVFEITFNRLNNQSSDIKLGDRIGESNEAKAQTIADKAVEQFVNNEFSNFVQNLPDYLPSADGFNNNWYGAEDPTVKYPGKVLINDIWYKPDPEHEGHKIMLRWTGEVWEEILRTYESEALRDRIADEIAQVSQSMQAQSEEHDRQVADILSKTQSVESLANQAKSDAASALARANQVKTEAIADARAQVATVSQALNTAKTELQSAIASADQKARDSQASATALRNDLNLQASKILEQAQAQTDLTNRVTTVETLADGTRSTVAELSKTVSKATGDITSVTSRTKTVEDTLSQTRTQYEALTQTVNAQTGQIDSINRKTADLQSGIDGVTERFEEAQVGNVNLVRNSKINETSNLYGFGVRRVRLEAGKKYWFGARARKNGGTADKKTRVYLHSFGWSEERKLEFSSDEFTETFTQFIPKRTQEYLISSYWYPNGGDRSGNAEVDWYMVTEGTFKPSTWSPAPEDLRSEIATYKRTAEESSAELSRQIQLADGKAVEAKTYAQQTAEAIKTRLESLETYKNEEGARASQYLTASRTETAKQLTAERTAIANNYVAKSIYDENVRGTTLKLNEIKTTADTAKQNLATYQNTVDRKLEELTSSTQTLDGKINTASTKVDTVAGQIRTEISEVEGKIPTENGGTNLIIGSMTRLPTPYQQSNLIFTKNQSVQEWQATDAVRVQGTKGSSNIFCYLGVGQSNYKPTSGVKYVHSIYIKNIGAPFRVSNNLRKTIDIATGETKRVVILDVATGASYLQINFQQLGTGQLDFYYWHPQIETGTIVNDWSPAPEDFANELSSVKTTITQTASGVEQLSTSLTTTDSKVTTAEAKIRNLVDEVSSKVSQTDYNTLTGRVDSAETAITQNATEISKRLTKTQVDKAITDKGYQTKSDVDSNITGRGYITNSALQPYALSTTVQNLVKETADSFSRTISETKALIPSGESNLVKWGRPGERSEYLNAEITTHPFFYNNGIRMYIVRNSRSTEKNFGFNRFAVERNTEYTLYFKGFNNSATVSMDVWFLKRVRGSVADFDDAQRLVAKKLSETRAEEIAVTFNVGNFDEGYLRFDNNGSTAEGTSANLYFGDVSVKKGKSNNGWSPSVEELATVTALHNVTDTVDSHTRTIGAVGTAGSILDNVSKVTQTAAGLVQEVSGTNGLKTQVSTLAGSYAIKNLTTAGDVLGQINLNPDGSVRINEGLISIGDKTYIKNGVIKSAMIGKGEIGTAHIGEINAGIAKIINLDVSNIKGLDAEFIKAKIENALIGWLRGKTISAVNNVTTFDLTTGLITVNNNQSGFLFKNGNSVVGRIGYGNIVRSGTGLSKGIDIYTNKNHSLALGYEMTNGMYSTAIQVDGGSGEVRIASPIYLSDKIYPLGTKSYGYLRLDPYGNSGLKLTRNSGNGIAFDDTDVYIIVNGAAYSFKEWVINRR
ncbi:hypothetical protein HCC14_10335, partial [Streptococcus suis]|nr:hypothetical protein [Streptococcus suis]